MGETLENKKPLKVGDTKDHLANERTFLAWIRTSVGIMAFGFVVEKFSFFIKEISHYMGGRTDFHIAATASYGYASIIGIALVALGTIMGVLAFLRFKQVEREIDEATYRPSLILDILVTAIILSMGIFFTIYMVFNI